MSETDLMVPPPYVQSPSPRRQEFVAYVLTKPTKIAWLARLRALGKTAWVASQGSISIQIERHGRAVVICAFEDGAWVGSEKLREPVAVAPSDMLIISLR